jgi:hypothetical protein
MRAALPEPFLRVSAGSAFGPYDFEIDTTAGVSPVLVESVLAAWRDRPPTRALVAR